MSGITPEGATVKQQKFGLHKIQSPLGVAAGSVKGYFFKVRGLKWDGFETWSRTSKVFSGDKWRV